MFRLGLAPFALAALLIAASPVFAQHYQERDHTVFHRPAPSPAASKRQPPQLSVTPVSHHPAATAANAPVHAADSSHRPQPLSPQPPANQRSNDSLQVPQSR